MWLFSFKYNFTLIKWNIFCTDSSDNTKIFKKKFFKPPCNLQQVISYYYYKETFRPCHILKNFPRFIFVKCNFTKYYAKIKYFSMTLPLGRCLRKRRKGAINYKNFIVNIKKITVFCKFAPCYFVLVRLKYFLK